MKERLFDVSAPLNLYAVHRNATFERANNITAKLRYVCICYNKTRGL